jgi:hypothetical protein
MDFKVVEIPDVNPVGILSPLIEAMKANVGKAIEIPTEDRNPNTVRKGLRSALVNRNLLKNYIFRSRVGTDEKSLIVWLEQKTPTPSVGQIVSEELNRG